MAEIDRVRWHCRRGLLELDLILAKFLDRHWAGLTDAQRVTFRRLLELPDNDLWDLAAGRRAPPDEASKKLIEMFD